MRHSLAIVSLTLTAAAVFFVAPQTSRSYTALAQATAQATTSATNCDLSSVFKGASTLKSSGDNTKDLTSLLDLARNIQDANVACNAMTFTGSGNFSSDVFDFKPGTYKVTAGETGLTDDNLLSVELLSVSSDNKSCIDQFVFQDTLSQDKSSISTSRQYKVFGNSKSCRVTMNVHAVSDWTLSFTLLK